MSDLYIDLMIESAIIDAINEGREFYSVDFVNNKYCGKFGWFVF